MSAAAPRFRLPEGTAMQPAVHPPRRTIRPMATRRRARGTAALVLEAVERRLMFHAAAPVVPLPDVTVAADSPPAVIDLSESFNDTANRTRVAFGFDAGRVVAELYDDVAPQTVANFLNYARTDRYDDTVV